MPTGRIVGPIVGKLIGGIVDSLASGSSSPPSLISATVATDGETWTLQFSKAVSQGVGWDVADLTATGSAAGALTFTYTSGDGTSAWVFASSAALEWEETATLDWAGTADGIEDADGQDLEAIADFAAVNLVEEPEAPVYDLPFAFNDGVGGPMYQLNNPRAVEGSGYTAITYQGPGEDPVVAMFTYATREWTTSTVGTNPLTNDSHGNPILLRDSSGYLHCIYGAHDTAFQYKRSTNPDDISAWDDLTSALSEGGTYPTLMEADGALVLTYRDAAHHSAWRERRSADGGDTWGTAIDLLEVPGANDAWYMATQQFGDDIVYGFCYHFHQASGDSAEDRNTTYYMRYHAATDDYRAADGTVLTLPLSKTEADTYCVVDAPAGAGLSENYPLAILDGSTPRVVWVEEVSTGVFWLRYSHWTGSAWATANVHLTNTWKAACDIRRRNVSTLEILGVSASGALVVHRSTDDGASWALFKTLDVPAAEWTFKFLHGASDEIIVVAATRGDEDTAVGGQYIYCFDANWFPVGSEAPPAIPAVTYRDVDSSATDSASYSFPDMGIGLSAEREAVVACVYGRSGSGTSGTAPSSVTIGGVSASLILANNQDATVGAYTLSWWRATVPTGSTATVDVVFSQTCVRAAVATYSATSIASWTPVDSATSFSNSSAANIELTVDSPSTDCVILASAVVANSGQFAWIGIAEDADVVIETSTSFSTASRTHNSAGTRAIAADPSSGTASGQIGLAIVLQ